MIRELTLELAASAAELMEDIDHALRASGGLPRGTILVLQTLDREVRMPDGQIARLGDVMVRMRGSRPGGTPWTWLITNDGPVPRGRAWCGPFLAELRLAATSIRERGCPSN
jgi:hypothetical protein